ncbi:hypothetical protein LMIY3S_03684 [Labrys miyagiensis]
MASGAQAAAHIFINERRFRELVDQGVITRAERGGYDLDLVRREYISNLRTVAAGREKDEGDSQVNIERARKDKEMADRLELQNAVLRREQAPITEMTRAVTAAFTRVRSKFLALPSKLAPLVVVAPSIPVARDILSNEIYDCLTELAATRIGDWVAGAGGDAEGVVGSQPAAEADGKRVGRPRAPSQRGSGGRARKVVDGKG